MVLSRHRLQATVIPLSSCAAAPSYPAESAGRPLRGRSTHLTYLSHTLTVLLAGRELGSYALEEYTSVKAVHWNFGEKVDFPF